MKLGQIHPVLAGLAANLLGSVIGAFLLAVSGFTGPIENVGQVALSTVAVALYGFFLALPFVFVYGMPVYALLGRLGVANLGTALIFGLMPGVAWVIWTHSSWIDPVLWNGTLIALFYFVLRQWRPRPNNSLKGDALKRAP